MVKTIDPVEALARENCARIVASSAARSAARSAAQPPTSSSTSANNGRNNLSPSKPFKCKICGKGFPSYHAIAGHTKIHRNSSLSSAGYECKKCNRRFSTGQALGGHTKSHNYSKGKRKRVGVEIGGESNMPQSNDEEKTKKLKTKEEETIETVSSLD